MNITQASKKLGYNLQYTRKLLQNGKIASKMVTVKGDTQRYDVEQTEIDRFLREDSHPHTPRNDGRNKYVLYRNEEELKALLKKCPELEGFIERANKPKVTA